MDKLDVVLLDERQPWFRRPVVHPATLEKLRAPPGSMPTPRAAVAASGWKSMAVSKSITSPDRPRRRRRLRCRSAVYGAGKDSDPQRYNSVIAALRAELAKLDRLYREARRGAGRSEPIKGPGARCLNCFPC